jgi:hypothetical protein
MKNNNGDMTPVLGGTTLPDDIDLTIDNEEYPNDDLGRMIYWLLTLHKDKLCLEYKASDIISMNDITKKNLITQIHKILGIHTI